MKSILICIDKFEHFNQIETTFCDVIEYFLQQNWRVDVVANKVGRYWLTRLETHAQHQHIRFVLPSEHELHAEYGLIWIFQGYVSEQLNLAMRKGAIKGKIVFQHFDYYADIDLPYGAGLENHLAWQSLYCSAQMHFVLADKGIHSNKLRPLPLSVPHEYWASNHTPRQENALKTALVIHSGIIPDSERQIAAFKARGIELHYFNLDFAVGPVSAELMANYQLIITTGRFAVQAMSLGIPVVLSNGYSTSGYLNQTNYPKLADVAFSVRDGVAITEPAEWAGAVAVGYPRANKWARELQKRVNNQCNLDRLLEGIVEGLPQPGTLFINDEESRSLELHRKVMEGLDHESVSIQGWLADRKPSPTRMAILHSFIQSYPEFGQIAVAVIDTHGDTASLAKTVNSLSVQHLAAHSITVIGDRPASAAAGLGFISSKAGVNKALNQLANETDARGILMLNAGATLESHALLIYAEYSLREPQVPAWYCDEHVVDESGESQICLKPDCDIDLLRSIPYIGSTLFITADSWRENGGLSEAYPLFAGLDLCWRIIEKQGPASLGHINDVLINVPYTVESLIKQPEISAEMARMTTAHLQRCRLAAHAETDGYNGALRIVYPLSVEPLVSIIIPTRDQLPLLRQCIESLVEVTRYPHYEIILVDNDSQDESCRDYLNQLAEFSPDSIRVLRWNKPFNFSAMNNLAAAQARGQVLLFLNNDTQLVETDWLTSLLRHALRPEVGAVGARLEYPDGRVEHGGFINGLGQGTQVANQGAGAEDAGFLLRLKTTRGAAALSAACMMVRADVFAEVGGFDEQNFPVYLADVDFCLRIRELNYLTVWTPDSRVRHLGGATRLFTEKFGVAAHPDDDVFVRLQEKWGKTLAKDPFYSGHLARVGSLFRLGTRTSRIQPPLPGKPLPIVMASHVNWTGCGNYRVIKPWQALERALCLEGGVIHGFPTVMEVASVQPDMLLLELPLDDRLPDMMRQYRKVSSAKLAIEYDDNYLNISAKNAMASSLPKDMQRRLQLLSAQADWMVVSTEPLAHAYRAFHSDIRVAQNRLNVEQWAHLKSRRREGKKPRVGWAGGSSHTGDLELLLPLMKALEDEVDWVFMGMKPEGVRCEFHLAVPFELYPEKLSTLDLDLALVPLENNVFNECKSNLRLLELGACGVPIICTDIEPYRGDLPVTRLPNRFATWLSAIREQLADRQALSQHGDELRAAIHKDWLLQDEGLNDWKQAWLG